MPEKYDDTNGELLRFLRVGAGSQFCNFRGGELGPTSVNCRLRGLKVGGYWDSGLGILWPDLANRNQNLQSFMAHKLLGEARKSGCCGSRGSLPCGSGCAMKEPKDTLAQECPLVLC